MKIIDGAKIARELEKKLTVKPGTSPCLGIIVFADDKAGQVYSRLKSEAAARVGINIVKSNSDSVLDEWNRDKSIHGILIQRPGYRGPEFEQYWKELVLRIAPDKDVDGLRADSKFVPATVKAVEKILYKFKLDRAGKHIVVVGQGMIGRQLAARFEVQELSSKDKNLQEKVKEADVLITACGRQGLIKAVKPGAIVIDLGWPKGDVDFAAVKNIAGWITPVPGGVGPVTVICLLENLVEAVYNRL